MSDAPHVVLRPNGGTITEQARDARAKAWSFVLRCYEAKNAAASPSEVGDNDGKAKGDSADEPILRD